MSRCFWDSVQDLVVMIGSLALGWGLAWLVSKGVSFIWPSAEPGSSFGSD